jgi:REP element-mobilizing transposase RayT
MKYNPKIHHRRSVRLLGYDYSQTGAYFITICTQNRECLFGKIEDGELRLNDVGEMIQAFWDEIPSYYPGIDIDEFIVMPNHIHGIIVIVGADPCGRPGLANPQNGQARGPAPTGLSLPDIAHRFKTMTTKRYADGVKQNGWSAFHGKLWQRNYWEHIIRNESELNSIRLYIQINPAQWELDKLHPRQPQFIQPTPTVGAGPRACPSPDRQQAMMQPEQTGQPQGVAPTKIREPLAEYGQSADRPNDEGWMV